MLSMKQGHLEIPSTNNLGCIPAPSEPAVLSSRGLRPRNTAEFALFGTSSASRWCPPVVLETRRHPRARTLTDNLSTLISDM